MDKIRIPVFLTTGFLCFYTITPFIGVPAALISTFFLMINAMFLWMVYRVLKFGVPSGKTFKESWYDDYTGNPIGDTHLESLDTSE